MARARSPKRDQARQIWLSSGRTMLLKDIAAELGVSEGQVRKWKNQDKWGADELVTLPMPNGNVTNGKKRRRKLAPEIENLLDNEELTDKERLFCFYMTKYFSGSKAVLAAGYNVRRENAGKLAYTMMQKPKIQAEVDALKAAKIGRALLTVDDIFDRMIAVATADLGDYVEFGQEEIPIMAMYGPVVIADPDTGEKKELTEKINTVRFRESADLDTSLLAEVKVGKQGASIKLHDQQKAWEWLADHVGMVSEAQRRQYELAKDKLELDRARLELERQKNSILDKAVDPGGKLEAILEQLKNE